MELNQFRDVDLVIDKANDNFIQRQFVSQGDYKGRTLTVQVTDNGLIGQVPGLMLNLRWQNQASGLADLSAFECIDVENNIFRIEYPEHMMTPGKVIANIQVVQNGKVTHLKSFELTVQRLAGEMTGIVGKAEYTALVAVLADANKFRTDIDSLEMNKANQTDLAKTDSQVATIAATKMDKDTTDIGIGQINKNKGKIDQTYLSDSLLQQIAGDAPINAVPADGSLTTSKYADESITSKKLGNLITNGPHYTGTASMPLIEEDWGVNKSIWLSLETTIVQFRKNGFAADITADAIRTALAENVGTSPNGIANAIEIPHYYFLAIEMATKTVSLKSLTDQNPAKYFNFAGCSHGRLISGEFSNIAYLTKNQNTIYSSQTGVLTANIETSSTDIYVKSSGISARGKSTSFDYTWAQLLAASPDIVPTPSPTGVADCILVPNGQMLVFNIFKRTLEVIARNSYQNVPHVNLLSNANGLAINGLYTDIFNGALSKKNNTTVTNLEPLTKIEKNVNYLGANFPPVLETDGTNVYVNWNTFIGRGTGSFAWDINWSGVQSQFPADYFGTSPSGISNCLILPNYRALVMDYESKALSIVEYIAVDRIKYMLIALNISGTVIDGELLRYSEAWQNRFSSYRDRLDWGFNNPENHRKYLEDFSLKLSSSNFRLGLITDTHYVKTPDIEKRGLKHMAQISELTNYTNIDLIAHLGDVVDGSKPKSETLSDLQRSLKSLTQYTKCPTMLSWGNHDDNSYYAQSFAKDNLFEHVVTDTEKFNMVSKRLIKNGGFNSNGNSNYYYKDFNEYAIRVINLNTIDIPYASNADGTMLYGGQNVWAISDEQLNWLAHDALNVPDNYHVLILTHVPLTTESGINFDVALGILTAFKNSGSYVNSGATVDFEFDVDVNFESTGNLIGIISGHDHRDQATKTDEDINQIILLNSLARQTHADTPVRTLDSATEDSFNVAEIDTDQRTAVIHRYGAGTDIEFTY